MICKRNRSVDSVIIFVEGKATFAAPLRCSKSLSKNSDKGKIMLLSKKMNVLLTNYKILLITKLLNRTIKSHTVNQTRSSSFVLALSSTLSDSFPYISLNNMTA